MSVVMKNWKWLVGVMVLLAVIMFWTSRNSADSATPSRAFETAQVDRGPISQSVATSGAVRPLLTVQVGSQLSGQVAELYADFNSEVAQNDLIARIDPQTFQTRVEAARADKAIAVATQKSREAELRRAKAFVEQRQSDYNRYAGLGEDASLSAIEMDALRAQLSGAIADRDSAVAQVENAQAQVLQRGAALQQAEVDLTRTEIRSPIDGVVILRNVDVGQTVAASLSAPVLFEIAQDLSRIQIEADVNEADIGAISKGNNVSFVVDAYPAQNFSGVVQSVRLAPTELQNVVTYTVIIHADNPGRVLYPGMTASVEIVTGQRDEALRIPNAAARFEPAGAAELLASASGGRNSGARNSGARGGARITALSEQLGLTKEQQNELQSKMRALFSGGGQGGGQRAGGQGGGGQGGPSQDRQKRFAAMLKGILTDEQWTKYEATQQNRAQPKTVWVLNDAGKIEPRRVRLGIADGSFVEIVGGALNEGDTIIIRANQARS